MHTDIPEDPLELISELGVYESGGPLSLSA